MRTNISNGRIRIASPSDGASLSEIYRPAVLDNAASFELISPDGDEMAHRISQSLPQLPWLVYEAQGEILGFASASPYRGAPPYQWAVELSLYVHVNSQGYGLGRALYSSLLATLTWQGFRTAVAAVTLPNAQSECLHKKMGFSEVGVYRKIGYKHGNWHDVAWFQKTLEEETDAPASPRSLVLLGRDPSLDSAIAAGSSAFAK